MIDTVKAFANCDQVLVVWQAAQRIDGLRGFAVYRKQNGGRSRLLETSVGFAPPQGQPARRRARRSKRVTRPSTVWPVQGFSWTDFDVELGDTLQYRVVPMIGGAGALHAVKEMASGWTEPVTVTTRCGTGVEVYFNRGIVAGQFVSRKLAQLAAASGKPLTVELAADIRTVGSDLRVWLAGRLLPGLIGLVEEAARTGVDVYLSLFELNDPELIESLKNLGARAHLILANGAAREGNPPDENSLARATLRGAVDLHDRLVKTGSHLSHHKFAVVCDPQGRPAKVWTGSTNWTSTGLCTQANNAILIDDPGVAALFRAQWDALAAAGNLYPPELLAADGQKKTVPPRDGQATSVWFAPMKDGADLADARQYIRAAKQGILFMMFDPGPAGTLLNDILAVRDDPANAHLYICGVLNEDPGTTVTPVQLFPGHGLHADRDYHIALPAAVNEDMAYFLKEVLKEPWARAVIHSKVIVVDPLGERPVVMTGSHNMGPRASKSNDDNLVIVEGNRELAIAYAVNIGGVYRQYHWNRVQNAQARRHSAQPVPPPAGNEPPSPAVAGEGDVAPQPAAGLPAPPVVPAGSGGSSLPGSSIPPSALDAVQGVWQGLQDNDTWQDRYFTGRKLAELQFWLGSI